MRTKIVFAIVITLNFSNLNLTADECGFEQVYFNPFTLLSGNIVVVKLILASVLLLVKPLYV